ncbi:MAG: endospore germination permease [Tissierellaceae bacterium]|nr:endospore germination permease [Tissierellaceae bacterium]
MIDTGKETITTKQGIFMVVIFTIGTSLVLSGITTAKQDVWISVLFALFAILPIIYAYSKILSFFPGKNLYEILDISLGKIIGRIISFSYIMYFLFLGSLSIRSVTEFIQVVSLRFTPQYFSGLWIILLGAYMVKSGIEVLGRWSNFVCVFILALILILSISAFSQLDYNNILPVLNEGWNPVINNAISIFSYPLGEVVVFLTFFNSLRDHKKSFNIFFISLVIVSFLILLVTIRSILILGFPLIDNTYFPTYYANTIVSIGNFIESLAVFSSIVLLLAGFAKFTVCLFAVCIGLKFMFNTTKYSTFSLPVGLFALIISQILFNSTMEMIEYVNLYPYHALPFQLILPLIILFFSWRKSRSSKSS